MQHEAGRLHDANKIGAKPSPDSKARDSRAKLRIFD